MLLILCLLWPYIEFSVNVSWFSINLSLTGIQVVACYCMFRLLSVSNNYALVGFATLVLTIISVYLFWLQLDIMAWFLVLAEVIMLLFAFTLILLLRNTNVTVITPGGGYILLIILLLPTLFRFSCLNYWVNWYGSQISQYNDLLPQFLFFFKFNSYITILVGAWLFYLTVLVVHLVINAVIRGTGVISITSAIKTQNMWHQWSAKTLVRFFNK